MCDYSLGGIPNRLAIEGDRLVVKAFRTGTIGLASIEDVERAQCAAQSKKTLWQRLKLLCTAKLGDVPAICVPPGALLILRDIPSEMKDQFGLRESEIVEFTQTSMDADRHRDALRFPGGQEVLLQRLKPGLRVTVLSLDLSGAGVEAPEVGQVVV
jgi:hypothetical protein